MPRINQAHEQFVLDIAYDFYGERMATCSMDKTIKVWELSKLGSGSPDSPGGAWSLSGTVQLDFVPRRITWAHPEYGQILACCGESRVLVLEELLGGNVIQHTESDRDESGAISAAATRPAAKSRWKKKAQLLESHTEVRDVEFAPRQYGLKLAAAASDGVVRIYEAINVVEGDWSQQSEFHTKGEAFAVSWRKLAFATERIAVATSQGTHVWEFNGRNQAWEKVMNLRRTFAGISGEFERDAKQIQDVAWAPNMGRTHDLVAVAFDGVIDIYKIPVKSALRPTASEGGDDTVKPAPTMPSDVEIFTDVQTKLKDGDVPATESLGKIWRLQWNITGTTLASSTEKAVCLWYQSSEKEWRGGPAEVKT